MSLPTRRPLVKLLFSPPPKRAGCVSTLLASLFSSWAGTFAPASAPCESWRTPGGLVSTKGWARPNAKNSVCLVLETRSRRCTQPMPAVCCLQHRGSALARPRWRGGEGAARTPIHWEPASQSPGASKLPPSPSISDARCPGILP